MKRTLLSLLSLLLLLVGAKADNFPKVILRGDYPDPTILRDGKDFYMTHSACNYAPGFLIWHSTDLVNWQPLTRVTNKYMKNAWAPELAKYKGKYYLYFPAEGKNYVCMATRMEGPWSEPVEVKGAKGIDPGHIATPDGKRYLFVNFGRMAPLNDEGTALADTLRTVHKGWDIPKHWVTEGKWPQKYLESPKLIHRNGYYYLTSAEGGTAGPATSHMVVSARAKSLDGPWEESPYNPVVHTWSATDQWWSKGHGTLIDDANGQWWIVYHAYAGGYASLGRQTLIEPVEWTSDGWFRTTKNAKLPEASSSIKHGFNLSDDFTADKLGLQWTFHKEYAPEAVKVGGGKLTLQGKGSALKDARHLLITAEDKAYDVQVQVKHGGKQSGLVLFYTEEHFSGVAFDGKSFTVYDDGKAVKTAKNAAGKQPYIRLRNLGQRLTVQVGSDGKAWQTLAEGIDVAKLNHNTLHDIHAFVALRPSLVVAGKGKAEFSHFQYKSHRPDEKDMAAYVMVYHKDEDHGLHMAISHDGYSFTALNGDKPVIAGDTIAEQKGIRDPHIYRGPDGAFYLAMTDLHIYAQREGYRTTEWERDGRGYGWGNNRGLVLMKSWDLLHWTRANIDFSKAFTAWAEVGCAWAPETIFDETTGRYMVYLTMRQKNEPNKLYYVYVNEDYNKVETEPMLLFQYPDESKSAIDGDITHVGDKYHLHYVSHDGTAGIKHAVSDRPTGGWQYDARWIDMERGGCEAPHIYKRIGEDKYVLIYDIYSIQPMNFGFMETSDFEHYDYLGHFNRGKMKTTNFQSPKHCGVVQVTAEEAENLEKRWGL